MILRLGKPEDYYKALNDASYRYLLDRYRQVEKGYMTNLSVDETNMYYGLLRVAESTDFGSGKVGSHICITLYGVHFAHPIYKTIDLPGIFYDGSAKYSRVFLTEVLTQHLVEITALLPNDLLPGLTNFLKDTYDA
jgi:hypothetical protein